MKVEDEMPKSLATLAPAEHDSLVVVFTVMNEVNCGLVSRQVATVNLVMRKG